MMLSAIAGGVSPTSMVGGISRSGTMRRNLNQAVVGANDADAERVEEADDRSDQRSASKFGTVRLAIAERARMSANSRIARLSGTRSAINISVSPRTAPGTAG